MKKDIIKTILVIGFALFMQCINAQNNPFVKSKKYLQLSTGIDMAYVENDMKSENAIVFIHGYTDTSRSFKNVIEAVETLDSTAKIICPDLRGHGNSSVPRNFEDFKIEDFSNDIIDLLNQKTIKKAHLVGHSLGSLISQHIAINHPERVKSLTLISAFSDGTKNIAVKEFLKKELIYGQWKSQLEAEFGTDWKAKAYQLTPKHLGEKTLLFLKSNWVYEARAHSAVLNAIYEETIKTPLVTWFETLEQISQYSCTQRLKELKIPIQILWGSDDEITPYFPDQYDLFTHFENAQNGLNQSVVFKTYSKNESLEPNIGHNFHWAFPYETAMDIVQFVNGKNSTNSYSSEIIGFYDN